MRVVPSRKLMESEPARSDSFAGATDGQLVAACLGGDSQAWEALVNRYARLIYSIPFKYGLSEDDAGDVFQSVCLILLEKLTSLRDHSKLSAWLITTTTRECWSAIGKRAKDREKITRDDDDTVTDDLRDDGTLPEDVSLLLEQQQTVRLGLERLPQRCQKLIWHLFYRKAGSSYVDISRHLGIPEGSIGPTRARCLEKLKRALSDLDFG